MGYYRGNREHRPCRPQPGKPREALVGMDKRTFKICEAVALGLSYYYMGPKDKRKIFASERAEARSIIPDLPKGWMQKKHDWDTCIY